MGLLRPGFMSWEEEIEMLIDKVKEKNPTLEFKYKYKHVVHFIFKNTYFLAMPTHW